jgi:hypothetical protein
LFLLKRQRKPKNPRNADVLIARLLSRKTPRNAIIAELNFKKQNRPERGGFLLKLLHFAIFSGIIDKKDL